MTGSARSRARGAKAEPALHFVRGLSLAGFHRLAVWEWGAANLGPPVVCVHGLTRQARDFDVLARSLAQEGRRVLCIDLAGRGHSDWLADPSQYHLVQYASDVNNVLAWARADAVDWVGTSLGGLVGMVMASQPGGTPIRRLVLNDVGPYIPSSALQRIGRYLLAGERRFRTLDEAEGHVRETLAPFGALSDGEWRHLTEHAFRQDEVNAVFVPRHDPAIARTYHQWQFMSVDLWRTWRDLHCPVLVLRGVESDFLLPHVVDRMRQSASLVRHIELPACGHAPSLLRMDHIDPIVTFLNEAACARPAC